MNFNLFKGINDWLYRTIVFNIKLSEWEWERERERIFVYIACLIKAAHNSFKIMVDIKTTFNSKLLCIRRSYDMQAQAQGFRSRLRLRLSAFRAHELFEPMSLSSPWAFRAHEPFEPMSLSSPWAFRAHEPFEPMSFSSPWAFRAHEPFEPLAIIQ